MQKQAFEDYKYVMQDIHSLYVGAKYTMEELVEMEDMPVKFRIIVERYLYKEEEKDITLESCFYYLEKKGIVYRTFKQLKAKLRISIIEEKKSGLSGKVRSQYTTRMIPLEDFIKIPLEEKKRRGVVIQEVMVSKLAMMSF